MLDIDQMNILFQKQYRQELEAIDRLRALGRQKIGTGAADHLKLLDEIASSSLAGVLQRRKSISRKNEILELVGEFNQFGAKAVLLTGSQRGGDFLNNQMRGQWAERVALSMEMPAIRLVPFGPSGAAMPGEQDHRQVLMTFKEIQLLEGKRPDLLGFDLAAWNALSGNEQTMADSWPNRRLEPADVAIVKQARFGAEVKNSTWHYAQRRAAGRGPLSITVKDEEVAEIHDWSARTGLPVVFFQVLFDELYCMSFRRMEAGICTRQATTRWIARRVRQA